MTLEKLIMAEIINDETFIIIRDGDFRILSTGNWYTDSVMEYVDAEIEIFSWQDDNTAYIDVYVERGI